MKAVFTETESKERRCEACGNRDCVVLLDNLSHEFSRDGRRENWSYRLLECTNCGLGLIDPRPDWPLIKTFYDESYGSFDNSDPANAQDASSIKFRIAKMRGARFGTGGLSAITRASLARVAEWATGKTVSYTLSVPLQLDTSSYIFDVGYGSGNWLLALSEMGYCNLYGYDIGANALNASRLRNAGVTLSSGEFVNNDYPATAFDCIRMEHVFEHLPNPVQVLNKCNGMLKSGGFLVMSFPCKDSWPFRISMKDSPAFQVPKHLFHHTAQSARAMLESAGFAPVRITPYSVSSQLAGTLNNILEKRYQRAIPAFVSEMVSPLYRVFGRVTGKGDFLTLCAVKEEKASNNETAAARLSSTPSVPAALLKKLG